MRGWCPQGRVGSNPTAATNWRRPPAPDGVVVHLRRFLREAIGLDVCLVVLGQLDDGAVVGAAEAQHLVVGGQPLEPHAVGGDGVVFAVVPSVEQAALTADEAVTLRLTDTSVGSALRASCASLSE